MPKKHKRKHKKNPSPQIPIRDCTLCANCQYIGEGDFLCDVRMKIVIYDWNLATAHRKCDTFVAEI